MNLRQAILRDADRCVLCGMCLPHCPTYVRTGNEAESPRGRISLMLALARDQLEPTPALIRHLDSCLTCRACESKCPSEVRYGRLIGSARRLIAEQRRPAWRTRLLMALASRGRLLALGTRLARTGAGQFALRVLGLNAIAPLFPRQVRRPLLLATREATAPAPTRGRVALFTGCTGQAFDADVISAARALLHAAGYAVEIPDGQHCCGALHHHQGDRAGFEQRARTTLQTFGRGDWEAVVFLASGCGAMLREYGEWLDDGEAAPFAARCMEITEFLARQGLPATMQFRADATPVAIHVPCSQANALRAGGAAERLLQRLPGTRLITLPDNAVCCGAAGSYMLTHPATAAALREPKLDALERSGARVLVTTNVGCALHLRAGIAARGLQVEVLHPVTFFARHLATDSSAALAAADDSH